MPARETRVALIIIFYLEVTVMVTGALEVRSSAGPGAGGNRRGRLLRDFHPPQRRKNLGRMCRLTLIDGPNVCLNEQGSPPFPVLDVFSVVVFQDL